MTLQKKMNEPEKEENKQADINLLLLLTGIFIMLTGSIYPMIFADKNGQASHSIATALFWSMSAGLVRGVGFVPKNRFIKWLFSGYACMSGILFALAFRFF